MDKLECMRKIVEIKDKIGPKTLMALHTLGTEFVGMKTLLVEFTNGAKLYIEADNSKTPSAYITPNKKFIPMDCFEMMNATFINENGLRDALTIEDAIVLESFIPFLEDECIYRIQMAVDKKHEFLKYMDNEAFLFKNMIILKR